MLYINHIQLEPPILFERPSCITCITYKTSLDALDPLVLCYLAKVPVFKCPKMGLRVPENKNRYHFFTPTSPQNG